MTSKVKKNSTPHEGVALWQIYIRYGLALVGALCGLIFFLLLGTFEGKVMGYYRSKVARRADTRIKLLGEMIRAMRVVKMYVWEGQASK